MANRDLNLILAALFELRLTCVENERTWAALGNLAEVLGGDRSAMFFGAPAPDRGSGNRQSLRGWEGPCVAVDEARHLSAQTELTDDERDLILAGLSELAVTRAEDAATRQRCKALGEKLGGDPEAMFFGAGHH